MRRIWIWHPFLEILNLWGSFLGLVTRKCKIQIIYHFGVKKCGESESDKHFWKFWIFGGLSSVFRTKVNCIYQIQMIHDYWLKNEENPNLTCIFGNFEFVGVFPRFSEWNVKNPYDTWFRGKKMRRFQIQPFFLRILNFWGSFLG